MYGIQKETDLNGLNQVYKNNKKWLTDNANIPDSNSRINVSID